MSIFKLLLTYDFDRPKEEILCDLILRSTGVQLNPTMVKFGTPKELDQRPDIDTDQNTYIPAVVDPDFDSRLKDGQAGFLYTRFPLSALPRVGGAITAPSLPFTAHSALALINAQLGLRLTADDIENTTFYSLDEDFVITAKTGSMLWTGSRYLLINGGGKKNVFFSDDQLYAYLNPGDILSNKKNQLNALANTANGVSWTHSIDFDFVQIEKVTSGFPGRNTRIFVKSKRAGYQDQWLYFARLDPKLIEESFNGVVPSVAIPPDNFTTHSILSLINDALGLHLSTDDVENQSYVNGVDSITIKFKSTSIGWLTGSLTIKLRYERGQQVRLIGDGDFRVSSEGVPRIS